MTRPTYECAICESQYTSQIAAAWCCDSVAYCDEDDTTLGYN